MVTIRKDIPKNYPRTFEIPLKYETFEKLRILLDTEIMGFTISDVAERMILDWVQESLKRKEFGLTSNSCLALAKSEGYTPLAKYARSRRFPLGCEERSEMIKPVFIGAARYYIETIPMIDYAYRGAKINPFYQKTPELTLVTLIEQEIPKHLQRLDIEDE